MLNIPYGETNFRKLRLENNLYVDKTPFIELLEKKNIQRALFLRPRKFGKSLWISTLWHYYDEYYKDEFEALFGDLYIGKHPTPLKNRYKVLFLEFSGIETENSTKIRKAFNSNVYLYLSLFLDRYGYNIELDRGLDADEMLKIFLRIVQDEKIYLLIDEYDHFANAILADSMDNFLQIMGKGGFVRSFYEVIKTGAMLGVFDRIFITGVTPITMDSLSSGFNIATNISLHKDFNEMCGFTQMEVDYLCSQTLFDICSDIDKEKLKEDVKRFYNGYLFTPAKGQRVYNSTLINYFLFHFDYEDCHYPLSMLDSNIATDYKKLMALFKIGDREKNYEVLQELIFNGEASGRLKDRYEIEQEFGRNDFLTLLFSLGFITIKKHDFTDQVFEIPNYVIKQLYFQYFQREMEKRANLDIGTSTLSRSLKNLGRGDINLFVQELSRVIKHLSNRDFMQFEEKHFKAIVLTLLSYMDFYFIKSESEVENRYPDIMLLRRNPYENDLRYEYLFELKWAKKGEIEKKKQEGLAQVKEYLNLPEIREKKDLQAYVLIGSKDGVQIYNSTQLYF